MVHKMDFNVTDFNVRLRTIRIRDLLLGILVSFALTIILCIIFPVISDSGDLLTVIFIVFLIGFFAWALRGTHGLKENFSKIFEPENKREIFYVFLINILFAFIVVAFFTSLDVFYSFLSPENVPMLDMTPEYMDPITFFFECLSSIVLAPIIEELVFRGVLFNRLKIRVGILGAMLISSGIFAIGHEFGGITSAFLFGICMCLIYLKTDDILITMSIHFINNLVAVILEAGGFDTFLFQMPLLPITLLISIIAGLLIIVYIYQNVKLLTDW